MNRTNLGHSAEISMWLIVGGKSFAVRGAGPSELVLAKPARIPASQAQLLVIIDGDERKSLIQVSGNGDSESVLVEYTNSPGTVAKSN
jgi:hypothetical protein